MEVCSKLNRQNFQKCKAAGMKTSWVLTEDDKSKVARRPAASVPDTPEFAAYKPAGEISIKTEAEAEPGLEHSAVKQRRPSSPMSPPSQFKSSNQFYPGAAPGDSHPLYSGRRHNHIIDIHNIHIITTYLLLENTSLVRKTLTNGLSGQQRSENHLFSVKT